VGGADAAVRADHGDARRLHRALARAARARSHGAVVIDAAPPAESTFDRERRAIGRLGHPHIVALFDVGPDWLATAYVDGTDLARRSKTPIDPATAVHVTLQIASAPAHAHAYGVVHRDVKPSNILIDTAGNAFLGDFGLALLPEALDDDARVGTPAFMAPEQARGELASPPADQ
jgi:serine/threonine-protein kinase